jgi:myo-inositol-1(or 4)-monophosphatase
VLTKAGGDPVTAADEAVDTALRESLPRDGEGWLSEETADDPARLACRRVWVVDPLDGTKEFVQGIPEWAVSIGLVEDGEPVAGGIFNPATGERVVGARGLGVRLGGESATPSTRPGLAGATVLASRSETGRGEWASFGEAAFVVKPMGSVAYKLARVAAGLDDITWTLVPKNEWDVAAGVALVEAAGGVTWEWPSGKRRRFNAADPLLTGLVATPAGLDAEVRAFLTRVPAT